MDELIERLLNGEPWTEFAARTDLLGQNPDEGEALQARKRIAAHPMIQQLIGEIAGWKDEIISNHKKAGSWMHKLSFLAETGLKACDDKRLSKISDKMAASARDDGIVPVKVNVPIVFGGSGQDTLGWSMCDAPLLMYSLIMIGHGNYSNLKRGIDNLANKVNLNGWACTSSEELGKFRGPGKKSDPCPYGTLLMLKLLAKADGMKDSWQAKKGADSLLDLWEKSLQTSPYMFHMGTDFRKLKAPFVWYDILHTLDVLSQFPWLKDDYRLERMIDILRSKRGQDGMYTAESVWTAWKGFEFAQKKEPSEWITLLAMRILKRCEE
jgi:hypothetical protein